MPKMKFNTRVKYKGTYHKGLEPFDVDEADVEEMQKFGGVLLTDGKPTKAKGTKADKDDDKEPDDDKPDKDDDKPKRKKKAAGD